MWIKAFSGTEPSTCRLVPSRHTSCIRAPLCPGFLERAGHWHHLCREIATVSCGLELCPARGKVATRCRSLQVRLDGRLEVNGPSRAASQCPCAYVQRLYTVLTQDAEIQTGTLPLLQSSWLNFHTLEVTHPLQLQLFCRNSCSRLHDPSV